MGNETLYTAAHAAGFAMAGSEEMFDDTPPAGPSGARAAVETQWQPGRAVLALGAPADKGDWIAAFLALFRRRAPTRRPALTAEA